jgi:hypothetical protein
VPSGSAEALRFLEETGAGSGELRPTVAVDEEEDLRSKGLLVLVFLDFLSESESESDEEESLEDELEPLLEDELEPLLEDTDAAFFAFFVTALAFDFFAGAASESLSELESLEESEELDDEDDETDAAFLAFLATGLAFFVFASESLSESLEDESELLESLEASDSGRAVFLAALRLSSSLSESLEDDESDDESEDEEAAFAVLTALVFFAGGALSASDSDSELELESELDSASFTGAFFVTFLVFFTGFFSSASDSLLESLLESELDSLLESLLASLSSTSMGSGDSSFFDSAPFARALSSHSANILARSGYPLAASLTALTSALASSVLAASVYPFALRKVRTRSSRGAGAYIHRVSLRLSLMDGLVHTLAPAAFFSIFCFFSRLPPFLVSPIARISAAIAIASFSKVKGGNEDVEEFMFTDHKKKFLGWAALLRIYPDSALAAHDPSSQKRAKNGEGVADVVVRELLKDSPINRLYLAISTISPRKLWPSYMLPLPVPPPH